ncbi:MAG: L,D-transpeptidase [Planctomycetota bacterium]
MKPGTKSFPKRFPVKKNIFIFPVLFIFCLGLIIITWNKFPGGWIKNRFRANAAESKLKNTEQRYADFLKENKLALPLKDISIKIIKSERKLFLYSGAQPIKTYRIGLGRAPREPKKQEGDKKTPVGEYYVCTRNEKSSFHLFLGLSYPNIKDAQRGLSEGLITPDESNQIAEAINKKEKPPWATKLGGWIGIHGSGSNADWTLGCIALDDEDVEELWFTAPLGTPVVIFEE